MNKQSAFTLIELMVVVAIVAIIAAIAIPSYLNYIRRAELATAQQEMQKIAALLEKHRSRNFNYDNFVLKGTASNKGPYYDVASATDSSLLLPLSATTGNQKYTLNISVSSQSWAINAIPQNINYEAALMTSSGIKCKRKYLTTNDLIDIAAFTSCGSSSVSSDW